MAGGAWYDTETPEPRAVIGPMLRTVLIFGSAAVVFALVAVPMAERRLQQDRLASAPGIDRIATGSVGDGKTYTIRRSVLQEAPHSVCIIRATGERSGRC